MVKITITCLVDDNSLEIETANTIPKKSKIREVLNRQFPCLENIAIHQEREN